MDKKYNWSKWLLAFIFAVAVITVYKTFDNLANVFGAIGSFINLLMPFIIGAILAFFLYPACKKVEEFFSRSKRKKISESKRTFGFGCICRIYTDYSPGHKPFNASPFSKCCRIC